MGVQTITAFKSPTGRIFEEAEEAFTDFVEYAVKEVASLHPNDLMNVVKGEVSEGAETVREYLTAIATFAIKAKDAVTRAPVPATPATVGTAAVAAALASVAIAPPVQASAVDTDEDDLPLARPAA